MIDIHSHIIPQLDDGSHSWICTLCQVDSAKNQGVTAMFATPHSDALPEDPEDVFERFWNLRTSLKGRFPDMEFYLGCEILCCRAQLPQILTALNQGRYFTMNHTKYILVEFEHYTEKQEICYCLTQLINAGWKPILAHAERYDYLRRDLACIRALRAGGCLIQLNVYSLEEYGEPPTRDWARLLIRERLVDFLATDTHSTLYRPPSIRQGMTWLEAHCSPDYLQAIATGNAQRLLIAPETAGTQNQEADT